MSDDVDSELFEADWEDTSSGHGLAMSAPSEIIKSTGTSRQLHVLFSLGNVDLLTSVTYSCLCNIFHYSSPQLTIFSDLSIYEYYSC